MKILDQGNEQKKSWLDELGIDESHHGHILEEMGVVTFYGDQVAELEIKVLNPYAPEVAEQLQRHPRVQAVYVRKADPGDPDDELLGHTTPVSLVKVITTAGQQLEGGRWGRAKGPS